MQYKDIALKCKNRLDCSILVSLAERPRNWISVFRRMEKERGYEHAKPLLHHYRTQIMALKLFQFNRGWYLKKGGGLKKGEW